MKRSIIIIALAISIGLVAVLTACGSSIDYSKRSFDSLWGEEFSWDMSRTEAEAYIKKYQSQSRPIETTTLAVMDDYYVFRFDDEELVFTKIIVGGSEHAETWRSCLGTEDEFEKMRIGGKQRPSWTWYGMLDGKETRVSLTELDDDEYYLQFTSTDSGY